MRKTSEVLKIINFENGITLGHIFLPFSLSEAVAAFVRAGNRFDPQNLSGLAHFVEHMTYLGTKDYPRAEDLHFALEKHGASYDAYTYPDYTYFTIKFAHNFFEEMVKNLAERIVHPIFKSVDIGGARQIILEELYSNKTNPQNRIWDLWSELVWQGTPLAKSYLGDEETIRRINKQNLLDFHRKYYTAKNTVFLYAGPVEINKVVGLFMRHFQDYPVGEQKSAETMVFGKETTMKFASFEGDQVTFACGFRTEGLLSKDSLALELLRVIIGVGWSSRLGRKLFLEEGLIYNWSMNFHQLIDGGYLMFQSEVTKTNLFKVIEIFLKEIGKIIETGLSEEELEKAKNYYKGYLLANMESPLDFIHWYGWQLLFAPADIVPVKERCKKINMVSAREIKEVCQKYCTQKNFFLASIGRISKDIRHALLRSLR